MSANSDLPPDYQWITEHLRHCVDLPERLRQFIDSNTENWPAGTSASESAFAQGRKAERKRWRDHPALADLPERPETSDVGGWAEYAGRLRAQLVVLRSELEGDPDA
jgi:hypothetical protein